MCSPRALPPYIVTIGFINPNNKRFKLTGGGTFERTNKSLINFWPNITLSNGLHQWLSLAVYHASLVSKNTSTLQHLRLYVDVIVRAALLTMVSKPYLFDVDRMGKDQGLVSLL